MTEIFLTPVQTGLILLACLYIVRAGRADWAAGIYLSLASWVSVIRFGSVNHIWVFLITMIGAAAVYWSKHRGRSLIPRHDAWIVPWMGLWWGWILLPLGLSPNDVHPTTTMTVLISLLLYTIAPLPIFLMFATDVRRLRGFALAYLFTTMVGGGVALSRLLSTLGIPLAYLLKDPVLNRYGGGVAHWFPRVMNIVNYHWFAYAFGISLVLIVGLLQVKRRSYGHVMLIIGAAYCAYFLLIVGSKQAMIASAIAGLLLALWVGRNVKAVSRSRLILLVGGVVAVAVSLYRMRPELVLRSSEYWTEAFNIAESRGFQWADGWKTFVRSPVWGVGFAKGASLGHNLFINTLGGQGLVGMVFMIGFLVFLGRQTRGIWAGEGTPEQALWRMAFLCVALFTLIQSQASGSAHSAWPLFWSAAILWRLKETVEKHESTERAAVSVGQAPQFVSQNA